MHNYKETKYTGLYFNGFLAKTSFTHLARLPVRAEHDVLLMALVTDKTNKSKLMEDFSITFLY